MSAIQQRPLTGTSAPGPATLLLGGLALASLAELMILRTFTRIAIHIPDVPRLQRPYEVLTLGGEYFYYLAITLLAVSMPLLAAAAWRSGSAAGRVAAVGIAAFAVAAMAAAGGWLSQATVDGLTLASVMVLAVAACTSRSPRQSAVPLLFGVAFVASGMHTALQSAGQGEVVSSVGPRLIQTSELAGIGFAMATLMLISKRAGWRSLATGIVVAAFVFGAFSAGGGSSARILLLWNGGLPGTMPPALYAAAAAAMAVAALHLIYVRDFTTLAGMCLLVAGGIGLHSTYQTGLVVAGLAALNLDILAARSPALERRFHTGGRLSTPTDSF